MTVGTTFLWRFHHALWQIAMQGPRHQMAWLSVQPWWPIFSVTCIPLSHIASRPWTSLVPWCHLFSLRTQTMSTGLRLLLPRSSVPICDPPLRVQFALLINIALRRRNRSGLRRCSQSTAVHRLNCPPHKFASRIVVFCVWWAAGALLRYAMTHSFFPSKSRNEIPQLPIWLRTLLIVHLSAQ